MQRSVAIFVVLMTAAPIMVLGHATHCNQGDDDMCLEGVRNEFMRTDYFFGDEYATNCPDGPVLGRFECRNPDLARKNIASRLLRRDDFDNTTITQFLHIRWNTDEGYYKACGNYHYVEPFVMDKDLDNTHTIYHDGWILSHRPAIAFMYTPGEMYTLIAYDAGYLHLSGMWVNIQSGDTSSGQELYPHLAPTGGMFEIRNPQVYALFRQKDAVEIGDFKGKREEIEQHIRDNDGMYDASTFIFAHNLEGPMAVGYLVIRADAFTIQALADEGDFDNCPYLFSKNARLMTALSRLHYPFNPSNYYSSYRGAFLRNLEMKMEIIFHSPKAEFDSCCTHYNFDDEHVTIDPLDDHHVNTVYLRYPPMLTLSPVHKDIPHFGMDKRYMLLLLDITEASHNMTFQNTTIEWQVVNIPGDNIGMGNTVLDYRPPVVKDHHGDRMYAFLLLRQRSRIDHRFMWSYTNSSLCHGPDANRCGFDLNLMVQFLGVRLASVATFHVKQDAYSRAVLYGDVPPTYSWSNLDDPMMDEHHACWDVEGYADPCPQKWMGSDCSHNHTMNYPYNNNNNTTGYPYNNNNNNTADYPYNNNNNTVLYPNNNNTTGSPYNNRK